MHEKRIGILTFHYAHNYGAMLQAYALKTYLRNQGYDAEIVNYVPDYMRVKYFHASKIELLCTFKRSVIKSYFRQKANIDRFNDFELNFLHTDPRKPLNRYVLKDFDEHYSYFIFGSDQIWNTYITKNDYSYFGDFIGKANAIAYAASSGNALNTKEYDEVVVKNVEKFKKVSVRERDAQEYLKRKFDVDADNVLDPVFLLSGDSWAQLVEKSNVRPHEKYILYYTIQDNSDLVEECTKYAAGHNVKVYTVHGEMKQSNVSAEIIKGVGPIEFLYLIKSAYCVYTNSFHALAFCLLFHKKAFVRVHSQTGNRVVDLLNAGGVRWNGAGLLGVNGEQIECNLSNAILHSKAFLNEGLENMN